jgi:long-chain acyl-CoA synthetase
MEKNPKHLIEVFSDSCLSVPERIVLTTSDGKVFTDTTYAELYSDVLSWAKFLKERYGVKAGDRVAAIATKHPNHFRFTYACWLLGAIAVPICESLGDDEMSFVIQDCEPTVVLAEKSFMKKATANAGNIPVLDWSEIKSEKHALQPLHHVFENEEAALESIAVLIYTSGSTGKPKGVMLSHRNLWWNVWSALECFKVNAADRIMSLLPYWHAYAMTCEIGCSIGGRCRTSIPHNIADFSRNIGKYQPTLVLVVPRIMDNLHAAFRKKIEAIKGFKRTLIDNAIYNASRIFTANTSWNGGIFRMIYHKFFYNPFIFKQFRNALGGKIRMFVSGGAPLDLDVQSFFSFCGMPVLQGYGLSEAAPVISSNLHDQYRLGSCGLLMPWLLPENGGDYTFKSEEGELGKNVTGQLLVKGHCVMKGYWRHTDASAKTMENGWLNTGDVGHMDKNGFLFIHGRNSSMIVLYGGEKLHPEYIEDAVKSSPMITEAVVIGEKCKNVYVCVNVSKEDREKYSAEELHKLVKEEVERTTTNLANYQKPKDVLILPDFTMEDGTMTATLKVRRYKIKEVYREQIDAFLAANGENNATKSTLAVPSSRIVDSLKDENIAVGNTSVVK